MSADDFDAMVLIADAAQVVADRLYILGGGRSVSEPQTPFALAIRIGMTGEVAAGKHSWTLELSPMSKMDGQFDPSVGGFDGEFEVLAADVSVGMPTHVAFAFNSGPLNATPGRYTWRLGIDGHTDPRWSATFLQL